MTSKTLSELKTLRDELKVQSHLFSLETKQRWDSLEEKFSKFNSRFDRALETTKEVNDELKAGHKMMIAELKEGYSKIKRALKS